MPTTLITDLSFTGEGVGREEGKVVFLPFTLPGERVEWERIESKTHFDRGLPRRILEASPDRILPACPIFERCGGCQLQHLDFRKQAEAKEKLFRRILTHALKIEAIPFLPALLSPQGFAYRHRLRLKTARRGHRLQIGFYNRRSRELVPLDRCLLANRAVNAVLPALTERLQGVKFEAGEVELQVSEDPLKGGVVLEFPKTIDRFRRRDLDRSLKSLPGIDYVFFRRQGTNHLIGESPFDPEQDGLEYSLPYPGGETSTLRLTVFPLVFSQAHLEINRRLVARLQGLSDLFDRQGELMDLYCGMGNLSLPLSPFFRRVEGLEILPWAVTNAEWNRKRNGIVNCTFRRGPARQAEALLNAPEAPKWILLDPPRSGIKEVAELLAHRRDSIRGMLYLSCNPLTLCHDLSRLVATGWKISWVQLVDFFPQTFHQECLVLLTPE